MGGRLLSVLPPLAVLRRGDLDGDLVSLLSREVSQDLPGQEAMLDRLLDILLISALRAWLARGDAPGGTARTPTPWSDTRCACCTTTRPAPGRSSRSHDRSGCRGPRSPGASPSSSASRP
ncbi:cupin domain-containing protein [Oerskovia sp. M15]